MQVYNLEIFTPSFVLKDHATVSLERFTHDFLYPEETVVDAPAGINVAVGDYVRLSNDICGVVSSLDRTEKWHTQIAFKPFDSLLEIDVMFDTDWQGQGTLEERLAQLVTDYLIENNDILQNVMGLSVRTTSSTTEWGFNLKALSEGTHKLIINLYETLLVRSLEEYDVATEIQVNFQNKTIEVTIGKVTDNPYFIEADLDNVIEANIALDERTFSINKLVMYDIDTLSQAITYYLHPDGTYDTNDENRLTPVEYKIDAVYTNESFETAAGSRAREIFQSEKINNLIEITVSPDDNLVPVSTFKIGRTVTVISKGKKYQSVVTGMSLGDTNMLILGAIRLDLTKRMRGRRNG